MELSDIALHTEALIFASEKPLSLPEITDLINQAFGFLEETFSQDQIHGLVQEISSKYDAPGFAFGITETGGGWQFLTKPDFHKTIAQLHGEKIVKRLSVAAIETLAIIAYRQPVTKGEIENIRGVNSDYSIQKLLEKELTVISGRSEDLPGKPLLYSTSRTFMDYFGINEVSDLPKIKEVLSEQSTMPTKLNEEAPPDDSEELLLGNGTGDFVITQENKTDIEKQENFF